MTKSDQYYFSDSIFQLELNLHNIRRELILMIEEFERKDCCSCLQLKCRCILKSSKKSSSFTTKISHDDGNKSKDGTLYKAPLADSLSQPKSEKKMESLTKTEGNKDIKARLEASRTSQKAKTDRLLPIDVLLAMLRKSWTDARIDLKKEKILDDVEKERIILNTHSAAGNAVDVFFNSFKMEPVGNSGDLAYVTNVAAIYGNHKSRSSEYTYF